MNVVKFKRQSTSTFIAARIGRSNNDGTKSIAQKLKGKEGSENSQES